MKDFLGNTLQRGDQVLWIQGSNGSAWFTKAYVAGEKPGGMIYLEYGHPNTTYTYRTYRSPDKIIKCEHTPGSTFQLTPEVSQKSKVKKKKKDEDTPEVSQW